MSSSPLSRIAELHEDGGVSEVYRGVRDFATIKAEQARWETGAAMNSSLPVVVGEHQIELKTDTAIEFRRARTQMHERDVLEHFTDRLHPSDLVWDVGANVGLYTAFGGVIADETVAIEPVPANVTALSRNLSLNDLEDETTVISAALGSAAAAVTVPADAEPGENHTLIWQNSSTGQVSVPIMRGDDLISSGEAPPPTVLKMDIEGGEAHALDGLEQALDGVRLAYVEVHGKRLKEIGKTSDEVIRTLEDAGFEIENMGGRRNDNYHIVAYA